MKYFTSRMEAKSLSDSGEVSGYASVFDVVDGQNDVVRRGAFAEAVKRFAAGDRPKLLWQHDVTTPIGVITELREDDRGLFIKCKLLLELEKGMEVYSLLKSGAIDGFSIGYRINDSYVDGNIRYLTDIDLLEVSVVTFPACREATISNVKSSDISNNIQEVSQLRTDSTACEKFLAEIYEKIYSINTNTNRKEIKMNNEIISEITELNKELNELIQKSAVAEGNKGGDNYRRNFANAANSTNCGCNHNYNRSEVRNFCDGGKSGSFSLPLSSADGRYDHYKAAEFMDYIRSGCGSFLRKSLHGGSGESGGYFVPPQISDKVYAQMKYFSPMRLISKKTTISSNSIDILVNSKEPDAGWASDSEKSVETDAPEIKQIKIPVHEIFAKPLANQKLLDDAQIDVEKWLISAVAQKFANLENAAFIHGNGENKPTGFLFYDTADEAELGKLQHFKTGADGDFVSYESAVELLINMTCAIKPQYAPNAVWIMSRSALAAVRKLQNKDGNSLWQPSLAEGAPSMLLGYPVILDDNMPTLQKGTKSASIAFGDFKSGYQIVDRQELHILRDPYTSKPFVEFYISKRTGGDVIDFDAIKVLKFEA